MAYTKKTWANDAAGATPITAAELNRMEDGISDGGRFYTDGVVSTGTLTAGVSLLDAPIRVGSALPIRLFEIRVSTAPVGGTMVFTLRRTTGTTAATTIGTVTLAAGSKVGRVDPNATLAEGDLLDIWLNSNGSTTTSTTVSATLDSKAGAATTAIGLVLSTAAFGQANGTSLSGLALDTGGLAWTLHSGVATTQSGRARFTTGGVATVPSTEGGDFDVSARLYGRASDNYVGLVAGYSNENNYYGLQTTGSVDYTFYKRVAGTNTPILQWTGGADGDLMRMVRVGTTITVYRNGTLVQTFTNQAEHVGSNRVGLDGTFFNATIRPEFDEFSAPLPTKSTATSFFSQANGTNLNGLATDTGGKTWVIDRDAMEVRDGRTRKPAANATHAFGTIDTGIAGDFDVQARVYGRVTGNAHRIVGAYTDFNNFYGIEARDNREIAIFSFSAGVFTQHDFVLTAWETGDVLRFRRVGGTLTLFVNGAQRWTAGSHTLHAAATRAGLSPKQPNAGAIEYDEFSAVIA